MAQRAYWQFYFQETFTEARGFDPVLLTGDGVEDLNQLIARIENTGTAYSRLFCDTGSSFSVYIQSSLADVYALRQAYIEVWGTVNKPLYDRLPCS